MIKVNLDKENNLKIDAYGKGAIGFYGSSDFATYTATIDEFVAGLSDAARGAIRDAMDEEPAFDKQATLF